MCNYNKFFCSIERAEVKNCLKKQLQKHLDRFILWISRNLNFLAALCSSVRTPFPSVCLFVSLFVTQKCPKKCSFIISKNNLRKLTLEDILNLYLSKYFYLRRFFHFFFSYICICIRTCIHYFACIIAAYGNIQ